MASNPRAKRRANSKQIADWVKQLPSKVTPEWLTFGAEKLGVAHIPDTVAFGGTRALHLFGNICLQPNICPSWKLASRFSRASRQA